MNELENFWTDKHLTNDRGSLSGCSFDETIDFLQVRDKLITNINILEVGVGLGYVTEGLSKIGNVSAIDISDVALDRVRPFCQHLFNSNETKNLPENYYDLIICHNVIQHIPMIELKRELSDIIKSLKNQGLFSLEFVSNGIDNNDDDSRIRDAKLGYLFRSKDFMEKIIFECGGISECVHVSESAKKNKNLQIYIFHVRKHDV